LALKGHYRASSEIGGSPGAADSVSNIPGIVVNEIQSRPVPPALDTIELYNPGATNHDASADSTRFCRVLTPGLP
jgi:hypothetical protein